MPNTKEQEILTNHAVADVVDDHVSVCLHQVIFAGEPGLLGQEAGDSDGLGDLLAVILQNGQRTEGRVCMIDK